MQTLADFIEHERDEILRALVRELPELQGPLAFGPEPGSLSLVLAELGSALRTSASAQRPSAWLCTHARTHVERRLAAGCELDALFHELALLRDTIFARLEARRFQASTRALWLLASWSSSVVAHAAELHARARARGGDENRSASGGQGTEHASEERALRASEARYRTLFDSIDEGFCLMQMLVDESGRTVDYRFLETNASFEAQTGLRNALGKTARELVPDLEAHWFERYGHVADSGEVLRFESGSEPMGRWFDVYAIRVGAPELRQVALVFKDVTEQKRLEAEHERLLRAESAARKHAEEQSRLKDEFLATLSHELRTPLTSMLGWLQLLRAGNLEPDKHARALEVVERNARAQAQLIQDLLDVSGILAGKLRLQVERVSMAAVAESAMESVRPAADAKAISLHASLAPDAIIMGDPHRLQQVVWNLLSNAVKFTPRDGKVTVALAVREACAELTVSDTGRGIPAGFLPHAFDRFRQADGGTTRAAGGLGLGLSIVRQLVELHGGSVRVHSDGEGRGATFTVELPLADLVSATGALASAKRSLEGDFSCPPELEGVKVLVVDDEEDAREMLRAVLESRKARVVTACSVAEGLSSFERERPDVVLSDIGMPDQDGYAFVAAIRKLPKERGGDMPVVALTAYARSMDRTRALLSGFNSHLAKPVDPLELAAVIASLVARRV